MFQILFELLSCINAVFATSMPARIWRERSTAEFPMMSCLSISFSASAAGRAYILTGAYNKMFSSETESTAF
jgi:hypothetical protein